MALVGRQLHDMVSWAAIC